MPKQVLIQFHHVIKLILYTAQIQLHKPQQRILPHPS